MIKLNRIFRNSETKIYLLAEARMKTLLTLVAAADPVAATEAVSVARLGEQWRH
jgi:hypothetical protein